MELYENVPLRPTRTIHVNINRVGRIPPLPMSDHDAERQHMKIHVNSPGDTPRVGNVYPAHGEWADEMMVLIAITGGKVNIALMLVIAEDGRPTRVTQFPLGYMEGWRPIAFVDGLEDLELTMRSL
jgi:hypothetical protein